MTGTSGSLARLPVLRMTRSALHRARAQAGGNIRLRIIVLFAGVEALASADTGTVGAVAPQLESALHLSTGEIGVIAAVAALAGAIGTVPVGVLTDRFHRVNLLSASIMLWCAAQIASAFSTSFLILVLTRVALGAVTATAGPTVASLTGDYFPAQERAKIWGLILTGELLGSGVGVVGSGNLASLLSWRYGFAWLAAPGLLLALAVWRLLVEPARGSQSRLPPGAEEFISPKRAEAPARREGDPPPRVEQEQELAQQVVRRHHERPHDDLVLRTDPVDMPIREAIRYVLRVRTNLVLVLANAMGYLFFAGVQTFAVVLLRSRYGLSEGVATTLLLVIGLGALGGIMGAGRIADRRLRNGHESARVSVAAVCYIASAAIFVPALLSPVLLVSMPLLVLAGAALAGPDPPLNAARLDIMHPRLWGRAEGVRTLLYMSAFALGPLLFGFISTVLGGPGGAAATGGVVKMGSGMAYTFLIMLVPLAAGGIILIRAARTYPRDVATAAASIQATGNPEEYRHESGG